MALGISHRDGTYFTSAQDLAALVFTAAVALEMPTDCQWDWRVPLNCPWHIGIIPSSAWAASLGELLSVSAARGTDQGAGNS